MSNLAVQILLIEDDEGDALLVERTLEMCQKPFKIHHCQCLEAALKAIETGSFDIALLDLSLPDNFGPTAVERIHESAPDLPIVVLTGLSDDDLARKSLERGAQDYIVKCDASAELLERTLRYAVQRQHIQSENRLLLHKMKELASLDALTGTLNRHSFAENLEREWQRSRRYRHQLACVILDIDFFKRFNDNYGHAAGDEVLRQVADRLRKNSRAGDIIGRLGGEEFCVLLPEISPRHAIDWAERLRRDISEIEIQIAEEQIHVTISIGVAEIRDDHAKPELLLDDADQAMLAAKQLGRNQVVSFNGMNDQESQQDATIWSGGTVEDLMDPVHTSLHPGQSMNEALVALRSANFESIPVLDDDDELVGVIGEDEISKAILTRPEGGLTVDDLMTTQLVTYATGTPSREVCEFFCRAAIRQVFIKDGQSLAGIVRRSSLLNWFAEIHPVDCSPAMAAVAQVAIMHPVSQELTS